MNSKTEKITRAGMKLAAIVAISSSMFFVACSKEGAAGPAGANGTNGTNGNANVKSQTSTNLTWTFNSATKEFETNISDAAITQDIVDKGAVLVYIQDGNTSSQLPASGMFDASTIVFYNFEYSVGNVKITFANSDLDNTLVPQSTVKFKIVAMSASARAAHPELNTYSEIKTTYNISE